MQNKASLECPFFIFSENAVSRVYHKNGEKSKKNQGREFWFLGHLLWKVLGGKSSKRCLLRAFTCFRPGVERNRAPSSRNTCSLLVRGITFRIYFFLRGIDRIVCGVAFSEEKNQGDIISNCISTFHRIMRPVFRINRIRTHPNPI